MKKTIGLLLLLAVLTGIGCSKKEEPVGLTEIKAHIIDGGLQAADGLGFYIQLDNTREQLIPLNVPAGFQVQGINAPVMVKYIETGKHYNVDCALCNDGLKVVYLVSIRRS